MGAIRNNPSRPNRTSQQTRTEDAAKAAGQKGLLHPGDVKRMTDGRVSFNDLDQAKRTVASARRSGNGDELKVAKELESAITSQVRSQGLLPTMMETSRDTRSQAEEHMKSIKDKFDAHRNLAAEPQFTPEQLERKEALIDVMDKIHEKVNAMSQDAGSSGAPRFRDPGMSPLTPFLTPEVETF